MLTPEQLEARKKGIGGSDAAAIAGLSRYRSSTDVYLEKLGISEGQYQSERMYFGNVLEPVVADEYARRTGKKCLIEENTLIHPKYTFMLANIDRKIEGENAILECKTTDYAQDWGESGTDEIPTEYLLQCAHYAAVCNVERVDIAVLIGLREFRIYHYHRNEKLESKLINKEEIFWHEHVLKKTPPVPTNYFDAMRQWDREIPEKVEIATDEIEQIYFSYLNKQKEIKEVQKKADELKTMLCTHMKDAEKLFDSQGHLLATWKYQERKAYEVKASSSRVLRLKEI